MSEADRSIARAPQSAEAVSPRLRWLLRLVLGLFALLVVNSLALAAVTFLEWRTGATLQDEVYLWNVLIHLFLGLLLIVPTIAFGLLHLAKARGLPNRDAARVGYALFVAAIGLLATGVLLMEIEIAGVAIGVRRAGSRELVYWLHVALPVVAAWLFVIASRGRGSAGRSAGAGRWRGWPSPARCSCGMSRTARRRLIRRSERRPRGSIRRWPAPRPANRCRFARCR
jgi:hypothetical protein